MIAREQGLASQELAGGDYRVYRLNCAADDIVSEA